MSHKTIRIRSALTTIFLDVFQKGGGTRSYKFWRGREGQEVRGEGAGMGGRHLLVHYSQRVPIAQPPSSLLVPFPNPTSALLFLKYSVRLRLQPRLILPLLEGIGSWVQFSFFFFSFLFFSFLFCAIGSGEFSHKVEAWRRAIDMDKVR